MSECVCVGGLQHLMKLVLGLTPEVSVTISTAAIVLPLAVVNDCGLENDNVSSTCYVLCDCVSDCVCVLHARPNMPVFLSCPQRFMHAVQSRLLSD